MRRLCPALAALFMLLIVAAGQNEGKKPKPSIKSEPLTRGQVSVYRSVLAEYVHNDPNASLNIADRTDPLDLTEFAQDHSGCLKDLKMETLPSPAVIHVLGPEVALGPKMVLVDPDRQAKLVKRNDPQKLIHKALHENKAVSDKEIGDSVQQAFATGLFTFSEIAFDKSHKYAVVQYSFWCGMLCGNGATLVLKKTGNKWNIQKHCSDWVS